MKLGFSATFEGAVALWRENRDLLVRVSAVFFFLPLLAAELFITPPDLKDLEPEAGLKVLEAWFGANLHWLAAAAAVQYYGIAVLLLLLVDPRRLTLGRALIPALGLLPLLILAAIVQSVVTGLAIFLFIVPALYLTGRFLLTGPALVALPSHNPFAAIAMSIRLTHGNGWKLFLMFFVVWIMTFFIGGLFGGGGASADGTTSVVAAVLALGGAAVSAAGTLALVLLQISAYRALTEPKQGI